MNTPEQDNIDNQLAAYALGALDIEDLGDVEHAVKTSPARQEELRQLREVVALLPYAAPPAEPPARARERLMARIAESQAAASPPQPRRDAPAARPLRRPFSWVTPAALAVLATLLIALGGLTVSLQQTVAGLDRTNRDLVTTLAQMQENLAATRARQDELSAQLATSQEQLTRLNSQIASGSRQIDQLNARLAQEQFVISFVSAPGVATRQLNAVSAQANARGEMYMYPGHSQAVVLFSGLAPLEPGKTYQFWLADGQTQVAGGTFTVDEGGIATLLVEAPREVNAFRQVMLTVEPDGGSATPSANVVLEGVL